MICRYVLNFARGVERGWTGDRGGGVRVGAVVAREGCGRGERGARRGRSAPRSQSHSRARSACPRVPDRLPAPASLTPDNTLDLRGT